MCDKCVKAMEQMLPRLPDREPTTLEVAAAMRIWEGLPEPFLNLLRPCVIYLAEEYGRNKALVVVIANADEFARIGANLTLTPK